MTLCERRFSQRRSCRWPAQWLVLRKHSLELNCALHRAGYPTALSVWPWTEPPADVPIKQWKDAIAGGYIQQYMPIKETGLTAEKAMKELYGD